jgi:hypothetical protein
MRIAQASASAVLVGVLALLGAGCGGDPEPTDDPPTGPTSAPPATAPESPTGGGSGSGAPGDGDGERERAPLVFNDEDSTGTYDCAGQNVTVNGDDADLRLTGRCGTVVVNGERDRVVVEDAEVIVVNGEDARVTYSGDPEVAVTGEGASADPA